MVCFCDNGVAKFFEKVAKGRNIAVVEFIFFYDLSIFKDKLDRYIMGVVVRLDAE